MRLPEVGPCGPLCLWSKSVHQSISAVHAAYIPIQVSLCPSEDEHDDHDVVATTSGGGVVDMDMEVTATGGQDHVAACFWLSREERDGNVYFALRRLLNILLHRPVAEDRDTVLQLLHMESRMPGQVSLSCRIHGMASASSRGKTTVHVGIPWDTVQHVSSVQWFMQQTGVVQALRLTRFGEPVALAEACAMREVDVRHRYQWSMTDVLEVASARHGSTIQSSETQHVATLAAEQLTVPLTPVQLSGVVWALAREHPVTGQTADTLSLQAHDVDTGGFQFRVDIRRLRPFRPVPPPLGQPLTLGGLFLDSAGLGKTLALLTLLLINGTRCAPAAAAAATAADTDTIVDTTAPQLVTRFITANADVTYPKPYSTTGTSCAGGTLVVTSLPSAHQWLDDIQEHVRDGTTKLTPLLYCGTPRVRAGLVDALPSAGLVITTYETLLADYRQSCHVDRHVGGEVTWQCARDAHVYTALPAPRTDVLSALAPCHVFRPLDDGAGDWGGGSLWATCCVVDDVPPCAAEVRCSRVRWPGEATPHQPQQLRHFPAHMAVTVIGERQPCRAVHAIPPPGATAVQCRCTACGTTVTRTALLAHVDQHARLAPLERVAWHRVIMDDSHRIGNPFSITHKAAMRLHAPRAWCVSGVPDAARAKVDTLQGQLQFVRVPVSQQDSWAWSSSLMRLVADAILRRTVRDVVAASPGGGAGGLALLAPPTTVCRAVQHLAMASPRDIAVYRHQYAYVYKLFARTSRRAWQAPLARLRAMYTPTLVASQPKTGPSSTAPTNLTDDAVRREDGCPACLTRAALVQLPCRHVACVDCVRDLLMSTSGRCVVCRSEPTGSQLQALTRVCEDMEQWAHNHALWTGPLAGEERPAGGSADAPYFAAFKLDALDDLLGAFPRTVVCSHFDGCVKVVVEHLRKKAGVTVFTAPATATPARIRSVISEFHEAEGPCVVFVLPVRVLTGGIQLRGVNHIVYMEPTLTRNEENQVLASVCTPRRQSAHCADDATVHATILAVAQTIDDDILACQDMVPGSMYRAMIQNGDASA